MLKRLFLALDCIIEKLSLVAKLLDMILAELVKFNAPASPASGQERKKAPYHKFPDMKNEAYLCYHAGYPRQDVKAIFFAAAKCGVIPERKGSHIYVPKDKAEDIIREMKVLRRYQDANYEG